MSESDSSNPVIPGNDSDPVGASSAEPVVPAVTSERTGIAGGLADTAASAKDSAVQAADSLADAASGVSSDVWGSAAAAVNESSNAADSVASASDRTETAVDSPSDTATAAGATAFDTTDAPSGWALDNQETALVGAAATAVAPVLPPDPAATWAMSGQREVRGSSAPPPPPPPAVGPDGAAPAKPEKTRAKRRRGLGVGLLIGGLAGALVAAPLALAIRASDDDDKSATPVEADGGAAVSSLPRETTDQRDGQTKAGANDDTEGTDGESGGATDDAGDDATAVGDASAGASAGAATPAVIRSVLSRVGDSVVSINTTGFEEDLAQNVFPTAGAGSGVVIDSAGLILTNAHVVAGATEISVRFADGEEVKGTVVGRSTVTDLALVRVETDRELVAAKLANSSSVQVGDSVIAIGNALALPGGPTVTAGIISAVDREIRTTGGVLTGLLQTSAAINPGNSGGPLLNVAGEVIGINTAVAGDAQNIGFAVSSSMASREIDAMTNGSGKATDQGFLGVSTQELTEQVASQLGVTSDFGAVVVEVLSGSAADDAGLQVRDVLIQIDGKDVRSAEAVRDAIAAHKSGDTVALKWLRGAEAMSGQATLQSRPVE